MNVLILNSFEKKGGAAVAAGRLLHALVANGVNAKMLVKQKVTSDPFVEATATSWTGNIQSKLAFLAERLEIYISNRFSRNNLFTVSTSSTGLNISSYPQIKEADIIHLHWINQGFLSIRDVEQILQLGKPIVWTMHDLWPVTGICHYPGTCNRYEHACGECPFLQHPGHKDLSNRVFQRKRKLLTHAGLHYVGCSSWIRQQAEKSALSPGNHFTNIPNPINTDEFSPGDQRSARLALKLPLDKKLLLFGADIASDKRKGFDYLMEATRLMSVQKEEVELVYCGEVKAEFSSTFGLKTHPLGYISDKETILNMYRAADCFVIPSLEDNLPNMIMEAMSCGIPCVGFRVGGIPEMIQHQHNGYIANYQDSKDLALGIKTVLENPDFGKAARMQVLLNYSEHAVAQQYIQLYQNALNSIKDDKKKEYGHAK